MLILTFKLKEKRFGLQATEVREVVPLAALSLPPKAPEWLAGLMNYRGHLIPVLDLCLLALGQPCVRHMSTRIILADYRPGDKPRSAPHLLGLMAERVTETIRLSHSDLEDTGLDNPDAPWLGPVAHDALGLIHMVEPAHLLPLEIQALLFTPDGSDG